MDTNAIIIILVVAGIIYFATRVLGKTLKLVVNIFLMIIVILALFTVLVYKDMENLKNGFKYKNNTFVLYENNELYTGIVLKPLTNVTLSLDSFSYFTDEEIEKNQEAINKKDYKALLKNSNRLFIFKPIVMNEPFNLALGSEIKLNEGDLLGIVMSNDPYDEMVLKLEDEYEMSKSSLKKSIENIYGDEQKLKGYLFAAMLSNYLVHQKPGDLVKSFKSKQIIVYPETISFKIIKYLPWV